MSRLQKYLKEEWIKVYKKKFEVLINPKSRDIMSITNTQKIVRFTADKTTKKIYVWHFAEAIHSDIWKKIVGKGRDFDDESFQNAIHGVAKLKGSKWTMTGSDQWSSLWNDMEGHYDMLFKDFKWVNQYIEVSKYFKDQYDKDKRVGILK